MSQKAVFSVIDQDRSRAKSLVSALRSFEEVEVILSGPNQWNTDEAMSQETTAAFVGLSADRTATNSLLQRINRDTPGLPLVVVGTDADWERRCAAEAPVMEMLECPINTNKLKDIVTRIMRQRSISAGPSSTRANNLFRSLVGQSAAIQQIQRLIDHVAVTDSTVLITGESGTGKEVVARNIHYRSGRRGGPFVPINCAAIPSELFESELFGHEKGAFTGAISRRKGRFELADTGTLFLDEIGDMPLAAQTKLLRVIQERVFERLGSNQCIETNVRIIAATHCDLEKCIIEKKFRKDLFYRLNVFPIEMPSLRHRCEDIPLLIDELRQRLKHDLGLDIDFAKDAMRCLIDNKWDGNVRELANAIERIAILFPGGKVHASDLPADLQNRRRISKLNLNAQSEAVTSVENSVPLSLPPDGLDLKSQLSDIEKEFIELALSATNGVVSKASTLLCMRRTTLVEKIKRYSIAVGDCAKDVDQQLQNVDQGRRYQS